MSYPTRPARDLTPGDITEWRGKRITVTDTHHTGPGVALHGRTERGAGVVANVSHRARFTLYGTDPSVTASAARAAARTAQEEASARRWQEVRIP